MTTRGSRACARWSRRVTRRSDLCLAIDATCAAWLGRPVFGGRIVMTPEMIAAALPNSDPTHFFKRIVPEAEGARRHGRRPSNTIFAENPKRYFRGERAPRDADGLGDDGKRRISHGGLWFRGLSVSRRLHSPGVPGSGSLCRSSRASLAAEQDRELLAPFHSSERSELSGEQRAPAGAKPLRNQNFAGFHRAAA